jgi:hypothetical protein
MGQTINASANPVATECGGRDAIGGCGCTTQSVSSGLAGPDGCLPKPHGLHGIDRREPGSHSATDYSLLPMGKGAGAPYSLSSPERRGARLVRTKIVSRKEEG